MCRRRSSDLQRQRNDRLIHFRRWDASCSSCYYTSFSSLVSVYAFNQKMITDIMMPKKEREWHAKKKWKRTIDVNITAKKKIDPVLNSRQIFLLSTSLLGSSQSWECFENVVTQDVSYSLSPSSFSILFKSSSRAQGNSSWTTAFFSASASLTNYCLTDWLLEIYLNRQFQSQKRCMKQKQEECKTLFSCIR